jgi:hypothetical protein
MTHPQPSRGRLGRALLVNALTKPLNVVIGALVLAAAALTGAAWLALVAPLCWLLLAGMTFFDEREAERLGRQRRARLRPQPATGVTFVPAIAKRMSAARAARDAIRATAATWPSPLDDLVAHADAVVATIEGRALSAQRVHTFLTDRPNAEPEALVRLRERLHGLLDEMDAGIAALNTLHAELLAADL